MCIGVSNVTVGEGVRGMVCMWAVQIHSCTTVGADLLWSVSIYIHQISKHRQWLNRPYLAEMKFLLLWQWPPLVPTGHHADSDLKQIGLSVSKYSLPGLFQATAWGAVPVEKIWENNIWDVAYLHSDQWSQRVIVAIATEMWNYVLVK